MFNWFKKKSSETQLPLIQTDIHSHLLPSLDDGVESFDQAADVILHFKSLGYRKLITTPHIMSDTYRNTPDIILKRLDELREHLKSKNIDITVEAAAEYYLDEHLFKMIEQNEQLLTFGKNFLLFETNFLTEPFNLKEFIFMASTRGYRLVLAHPERYLYLQNSPEKIQDLLDRGVLFQLNASSITGYYSKVAQNVAYKLIKKGCIHFLGSDCHQEQHVKLLENAQRMKYFQKALSLPLLNNTL